MAPPNSGNLKLVDSGERRLEELGYKQELKRDLSYVPFPPMRFTITDVHGYQAEIVLCIMNMISSGLINCKLQVHDVRTGFCGLLQSAFKFRRIFLRHGCDDRDHVSVQHWAHFWSDNIYSLRVAHRGILRAHCWPVHGRNLLLFPNVRWPVLLESRLGRTQVGAICILDHRLVDS